MNQWSQYSQDGWVRFAYDRRLVRWIDDVYEMAAATLTDPQHRGWWRHQGTWFAGVNVLSNDEQGRCRAVALQGDVVDFINKHIRFCHDGEGNLILDKAQISVCTQGYPQQDEGESNSAHRFRFSRDAAHLDGLLKENGRRYLKEQHGFILGIGMHDVSNKGAPFVIYQGSHVLVQAWLQERLQNTAATAWGDIDLTDEYKNLRQRIFDECERVTLPLQKGESFVVHRFAIHGTANWTAEAGAIPDNRMLAFFRPSILGDAHGWLNN